METGFDLVLVEAIRRNDTIALVGDDAAQMSRFDDLLAAIKDIHWSKVDPSLTVRSMLSVAPLPWQPLPVPSRQQRPCPPSISWSGHEVRDPRRCSATQDQTFCPSLPVQSILYTSVQSPCTLHSNTRRTV